MKPAVFIRQSTVVALAEKLRVYGRTVSIHKSFVRGAIQGYTLRVDGYLIKNNDIVDA